VRKIALLSIIVRITQSFRPMQSTASNQNNEQSRRALEKAREIGAAGQDPAAENLKREALGRLQAHDKSS
jgi:hypothetical protein